MTDFENVKNWTLPSLRTTIGPGKYKETDDQNNEPFLWLKYVELTMSCVIYRIYENLWYNAFFIQSSQEFNVLFCC